MSRVEIGSSRDAGAKVPPVGVAWAAKKQASASLLAKIATQGGRGCPSPLGSDHIDNVFPPLAQVVGSGEGVAEASAEATAG